MTIGVRFYKKSMPRIRIKSCSIEFEVIKFIMIAIIGIGDLPNRFLKLRVRT